MIIKTIGLTQSIYNNVVPLADLVVQNAVSTTLIAVKNEWTRKAQEKLKSTYADYLGGLGASSFVQPYEGNPHSGAVILRGKLPNMLETGFSAFDMKIGFSKSVRKRTSKNGGWYITVPFRRGTPKSHKYGSSMPKDIYKKAKNLKNNKPMGLNTLNTIKDKNGAPKYKPAQSWTGYNHKSSIHLGMTRIVKQYESGTKQSSYYTFRRASSNSDPLSWMHPGYAGVKIADSLEPYASREFERVIKQYIAELK